MGGVPDFEKERYARGIEGYQRLYEHYASLSDEEIYKNFVLAGGRYFGNTVEEARAYLLNYFKGRIGEIKATASKHAAIWRQVEELRRQGYQTMVTEHGIEAYRDGRLIKVLPIPSSEEKVKIEEGIQNNRMSPSYSGGWKVSTSGLPAIPEGYFIDYNAKFGNLSIPWLAERVKLFNG